MCKKTLQFTFIFLSLAVFMISCSDDEKDNPDDLFKSSQVSAWENIGKLDNGTPIITVDKSELIDNYNANLLEFSKIDGDFTDVEIVNINEDEYQLVFTGDEYSSTFLVRETTSLTLEVLTTTSCTTKTCPTEPRGCVVMYDHQDIGYCSPCDNGGDCTKTTSTAALF